MQTTFNTNVPLKTNKKIKNIGKNQKKKKQSKPNHHLGLNKNYLYLCLASANFHSVSSRVVLYS
jgi:hypothetical protein